MNDANRNVNSTSNNGGSKQQPENPPFSLYQVSICSCFNVTDA